MILTMNRFIGIFLAITLLLTGTIVYADHTVNSHSWYDDRATNWTKYANANPNINCLGYVLGTNVWDWPWSPENPTAAQATAYLNSFGYSVVTGPPYNPKIISYGDTYNIRHFARGDVGTSNSHSRAKWGPYEYMTHEGLSPYKDEWWFIGYGNPVNYYNKK